MNSLQENKTFTIAIANDHGGYALKKFLMEKRPDINWIDLGCEGTDSVDYPDYAYKLAQEMKNNAQIDFGVVICGSGLGVSYAANRYAHIRSAPCTNTTLARLARIDNNANVLALGERVIGQLTALDVFDTFITTKFEAGGRHERRVNKLSEKGE